MPVTLLDREMYAEAHAARLLGVPQSTLHWWLEGGVRRSRPYPPVIRPVATDKRVLTWAEFVEAALLRRYRRDLRVQLAELRTFIDLMRVEYGVPYPLADRRPYVGSGRSLLIDLQDRSDLDPDFCLVAVARGGQAVLTTPGEEFFERVEWDDDVPVRWRPTDDRASRVRIDPLVRFGQPAVGGVSTIAIAGELDAGASFEEVAQDFDLDLDEVQSAYSYELSLRAA